MTYCAGWKYRNAVFLIGDTAVTKTATPTTTHTSFGQLHAEVQGEHVEEGLLKLVPLGAGMVAAFAGDVHLATTCLDFLRDNLGREPDATSALRTMTLSLGPFPKDRLVELIVATSGYEGDSNLHHWNSIHGLNESVFDYCQIGSLTSYHAAVTRDLLSRLVAEGLDTERMLAVITAVVQSYGVHDDIVSMNVGGLIFGVQTKMGIVSWHQDVNVVLYDPGLVYRALISAIARDNTVVVCSSITDDTRVLGHTTSLPKADLWTQQWLDSVKKILDSGKCPVWVFINTMERVITLIFRENLESESRYIRFQNQCDGKFELAISGELTGILREPLVHDNGGSVTFRLNVRND